MLYTLAQRLYPRVLAQKNRDPVYPKQKIKDPWTVPKATILANMKGDLPSIEATVDADLIGEETTVKLTPLSIPVDIRKSITKDI